ncbi:MAG: alpha-1,2-fucosyltransferase [Clostridia bacterium]|nr:alpha-1,2-fucosyltransferase [Clostridia bacterium]
MIIWFGGGLGNQLFQYALYHCAEAKGYPVYADLSFYNKAVCHNGFELESIFGIKLRECDEKELRQYKDRYDIIARAIRKLLIPNFGLKTNIIREQNSRFIDGLISEQNKDSYLLGYWQSNGYFTEFEKEIKDALIFPQLDERNLAVEEEIKRSSSVSIHVRRGDYLNKDNINLFSNLGDSHYYDLAISYLESRFSDLRFYIFSNDNDWCRRHLKLKSPAVFVDWNNGIGSYKDMQLMAACKHNIIANSSFSWWGAWLNRNPGKTVIAPEKWFIDKSGYSNEMIIPIEWVRIDG